MDVESHWSVMRSERRGLAELLASLTDEQWETPSLCAGWRVRDVAAHLALVPLTMLAGAGAGADALRARHHLASP